MEPLLRAGVWLVLVLVVAAHFAFLVYLPLGGFLALRWRRSIWLHVAAVTWALGSVIAHYGCPLTDIERWARSRAGLPSLGPAGFIDHYVTGVFYPAAGTGLAHAVVFSAVVTSWIVYAATGRGAGRTGRDVGP
jgi:hypothetical protein